MKFRRGALLLASVAAFALPLRAQDPGTFEIELLGKYSRFSSQMPWSQNNQTGFGGLIGYFVLPNLAIELTGTKTTGGASERQYEQAGQVTYFFGLWGDLRMQVGAGYVFGNNGFYNTAGPPERRTSDVGGRGLLGVSWQFDEHWGLRADGSYAFVPSPQARFGVKSGSTDKFASAEVGLVYRTGGSRDADGDGVSDKNDKCPDTPAGVKVDDAGCPIDTDKDGVADYLDKCPDTPAGVRVDASGCPVDSDRDGVPDYLDKCPNTPTSAKVDATGCAIDTDKDGVPDYLDKCPNTPAGVKVDAAGCPIDTDKDGVPDYLDKCPNTVPGTKVDANGCSIDSDSDGVADTDDKCPNTPRGVTVYKTGDKAGCPVDTDGDGVPDYLDKCANTPSGSKVDANGCIVLFEAGKKSLTLQGVTFVTAKADLLPESSTALDRVAESLAANPDVKIAVEGYTDNRGGAVTNRKLSQARADAVRNYLISKGVPADNVTAKGFGSAKPVASNTAEAGRAQNRRVELRRTN